MIPTMLHPTARRNRFAFGLADCMIAMMLIQLLTVAYLNMHHTTVQGAASTKAELQMYQLATDLLDQLVAGEARELLAGGAAPDGSYAKDLDGTDLEALGLVQSASDLPADTTVEVRVELPRGAVAGQRMQLARIQCRALWRDAARHPQRIVLSALTDSL